METEVPRTPGLRVAWAAVPVALLALAVVAVSSLGDRLIELVGSNPPPADTFDVRRVEFQPGEIRIRVTNPQPDPLTIAVVTVDDAIVPFSVDGDRELDRLRSATIVVPYAWVQDDPYVVGVTSSSGIQTVHEVPAAVAAPERDAGALLGYAGIGFLVGMLPVALGLAWLPSLRQADPRLIGGFLALTAGLLCFVAADSLGEALSLQQTLPAPLQGLGLIVLGVAISYLGLSYLGRRMSSRGSRGLSGAPLALLVAIGIGVHNLGEGLAIGSSFALGELALATSLVIGFMIHNLTEGLGIASPLAAAGEQPGLGMLLGLAALAGLPTVLGAWIGGFLTTDLLGVLFLSVAVGAALQVVVEVAREAARRLPGGLSSGHAAGGFLAGVTLMWTTSVLVG